MKLLMPLLAALLAANLCAQKLDSNPPGVEPVNSANRIAPQVGEVIEFKTPLAQDDGYKSNGIDEMTMQAPGILANDIGEDLIAMLLEQEKYVAQGTLTIFKDGGFTYQPLPGFVGEDIFIYQALDASGVIVTAMITFYCLPAETPPEILLASPGMPASGSGEDAASCSAAHSSAPWLLLPMLGLALMRVRRARA